MSLFVIVIFSTSYFFSSSYFFSNENAVEENIEGTIKSSSLDSEDPEGWPEYANSYISDLTIAFFIRYSDWDPYIPYLYTWEDQDMTVSFKNYAGYPYPPQYHTSKIFTHHGSSSFFRELTYRFVYGGYSNSYPSDREVHYNLKSDYIWLAIFPDSVTYVDTMLATRADGPSPFPVVVKNFPIIDGDGKGGIAAWYYSHAYTPSIGFSKPSVYSNEEYDVSFEVSKNDAQDVGDIYLQRKIQGYPGWTTVRSWYGLGYGEESKIFSNTESIDVGAYQRSVYYRVLIQGQHYRWRSSQYYHLLIKPKPPDTTPPVVSITSPTDGLITNQDVVLSYTASDDESAPADIDINGPASGTTYSSEGTYDITITTMDEAGNSAIKTVSFTIDKTAPDINFYGSTTGWHNTDQTISWEVTDDHIDLDDPNAVISNHLSPTTFSSEGTHIVSVTATDLAGNTASNSLTIVIDKTAPVIMITGPPAGYYNTDQTVEWTVSDPYLDDVSYTHDTPTTFTEEGTYQVTVSADDLAGNFASGSSAEFVIDKTLPETLINFGDTHFIINDNVHLTSATPIELLPSDLSGISGSFYKVSNDTFDSGWILYTGIFSLNSLDLHDGDYVLHYYSTDIAGNSETAKTKSIVLDNSPPELSWEYEGFAFQDGILFNIEALDATEVTEVVLSIRELNGPIVTEIPVEYVGGNNWQAIDTFDSITVPDGYYELVVDASDKFDFMTTEIFSFSIRNWAVLELLPSTESNKAGRTMPVKFALRVVEAVDPNMPFVVNQELHIFIADTATDEILQHSTYGDTSRDYRINELTEHYITNFKTHKTPTIYLISIYRRDFFIGDFSFATVK